MILFLFFTLIVTAGLMKYKMMFLKHLQESNSIISFPETYHLLWCNDLLYLYLVILFLGTCDGCVAQMWLEERYFLVCTSERDNFQKEIDFQTGISQFSHSYT